MLCEDEFSPFIATYLNLNLQEQKNQSFFADSGRNLWSRERGDSLRLDQHHWPSPEDEGKSAETPKYIANQRHDWSDKDR